MPGDHVTLQVLSLHEAPVALRARVARTRVALVNHGAVRHQRRASAERLPALFAEDRPRPARTTAAALTPMRRAAMGQQTGQIGAVFVTHRTDERRLVVTGSGHVRLVVDQGAERGAT